MSTSGGVLSREDILELIKTPEPLVDGYLDLDAQLQPNGFDLTLREVLQFASSGETGAGREPSVLPGYEGIPFHSDGYLHLSAGAYLVTFNEVVDLPRRVMALARPRSSLLRSGVAIHTAVWDAGYRGRSQALMTVHNPLGYRVAKDARLLQMVFMYLARPVEEGYAGRFQGRELVITWSSSFAVTAAIPLPLGEGTGGEVSPTHSHRR